MSVSQAAIALLTGGGLAILLDALRAFINRKKLAKDTDKAGADAASVVTAAALTLVQPLQDRIHELTSEVDELRAQVKETTAELSAARAANQAKDVELEQLRAARRVEGASS